MKEQQYGNFWALERHFNLFVYTLCKTDMLKVHKTENFFGSDFEFCVISLLVMLKY
jgi:hypothetical protein